MGIIDLARNNKKDVKGIVINAFTKPFVVTITAFDYRKDEHRKRIGSIIRLCDRGTMERAVRVTG